MEEEEWRIVKEFKGYLMVSSLGRVHFNNAIYRSKSGRVLIANNTKNKKTVQKSGNKLKVGFRINDKIIHRNIASLIAKEFIPNPKNCVYVEHLNKDMYDLRKDNLKWVETEVMKLNKIKGYRNNKKLMSIETFEHDVYVAQQYHSYTIEQYDKDKNFVKVFFSMRLVQRNFNIPIYTLRRMLIYNENELNFMYEGNYFKFKYQRDIYRFKRFHKSQKKQHINILQYTKDGQIYAKWHDVEAAAIQNGLQASTIKASCDLDYTHKYYGGYLWRYQVDDNVPTTIDTSNEIYYNEGNKYIDL